MTWKKTSFPLRSVNFAQCIILVPISLIFHYNPRSEEISLRWNHPWEFSFSSPIDYRKEIYKDAWNIALFVIWTFQVLVTIKIVYYHITTPHHPKFYSTKRNRLSIICHIVGGTVGILGFWIGALSNQKPVCIVAAFAGATLHLPSVIWQIRQLHGKQEISVPAYNFIAWMLFQGYVDFFLYDCSYEQVFICAMTLNIFAMVRFFGSIFVHVGMKPDIDRAIMFAGFFNGPFILGKAYSPLFLFSVVSWNFIFDIIKPCPRFMIRMERGYNDMIPKWLQEKRGVDLNHEFEKHCDVDDKKEAIALTIFDFLREDQTHLGLSKVAELYDAWGMPDARDAAKETFKKADKDHNHFVDYEEFKIAFKYIIDRVFLKGEFIPEAVTPSLDRKALGKKHKHFERKTSRFASIAHMKV